MKYLLIMRHAKSSWDLQGLRDIERPLNDRGSKDAELMGNYFKNKFTPQTIYCSIAQRTKETADHVISITKWNKSMLYLETDLYTFNESEVLSFIRNIDKNDERIMIIGHNPALTHLCNLLGSQYIDNLPTAGAMLIAFELDSWADIGKKKGITEWFNYPSLFR